jgi:phosphate-selective porin OprO/OprP
LQRSPWVTASLLWILLWSGGGWASVDYSWPGVDLAAGGYTAHISLRAQLRHTESRAQDISHGNVNRARFKLGGDLGSPSLGYYTEYDFPSERLLDMRLTYSWADESLNARAGQWKVPFNRERIDSSGKQQFADRSISNTYFTLDRQRGVAVSGRVRPGSHLDSTWTVAVLEGAGRTGAGSPESPMWLGRWQWNAFGRELEFSQGDTGYREDAAGGIAVGAARFRGPYTAFSSAGGGQLAGFDAGGDDRYRVEQAMIETTYQHAGFSWQQEYHYKHVDDTALNDVERIHGGYAQVGWFPHARWKWAPRPLEFAARYARVDADDLQLAESTFGVNWFFSGHNNKLTADFSYGREKPTGGRVVEKRTWRLQWDFHL